ncbi:rna-directed dna polymerase from mobile element jockey-like [Willisornis vidua]|uniref:Rna-directed dna polymerase from mobile element jockey-like n=1 Tax=Willisornis vidua TaxID=1566151 RepID=A0ABQ9D6P0_9PASS|nr:rna-directed dna polymerase from mobile element jockey-like [Willisornis vidua]
MAQSPGGEMTGGVPQGSTLEPVLFGILINDTDNGIKCSLNEFVHSTKMSGMFDVPEGQSAIQGDLEKHEKQACVNLTRFMKGKCRTHLGQGSPEGKPYPGLHQK